MKEYGTRSIILAAALLEQVPGAHLRALVEGTTPGERKTFLLAYPESLAAALERVVEAFNAKRLSVDLFRYNQQLNYLRTSLKTQESGYGQTHLPL